MLSRRLQQLSPSPTLALDASIKNLQAQGIKIINLCLGEPDFATPENIGAAAIKAIKSGFTHYTATAGIPELRAAIAQKLKRDNHLEYSASEIAVGVGAKQMLYNAFQVLCDQGDEVLLPTPTWSTFAEQIKLSGAEPILIPLAPPFKLRAADLEPHITAKTKCVLVNTPSNPTGAMIDRAELEKIAALAVKHNLWLIADEIYEKLVYGLTPVSIASLNPQIKKQTITINGFSKAYAMTGWRLGYAAGPAEVIGAMVNLQSQTTSNAASIAQQAGVEALTGDQSSIDKMLAAFTARRTLVSESLAKIPGLSFTQPEGAFYFFINIKKLFSKKYPTSTAWCQALLDQQRVGVVPGEAFFAPGYFRLSFAASDSDLKTALLKIAEFITTES